MQKKSCALSLLAAACAAGAASSAHASQLIYEPFNYTAGQPITGQVDTYAANPSDTWQLAGPTALHVVGGSSLSPSAGMLAAGFPPAIGNDANLKKSGTSASYERLAIPNAYNSDLSPKYAAGSQLYYSLMLQISSISGLTIAHSNANAVNDGLVSFNNIQGSSAGAPSNFEGELNIRLGSTPGTYNLGIHATTTTANTGTYWTGDITPSTTPMFIVAELQLGIGNTDPGLNTNDLNSLWVNPNPSTFGLSEGSRPAPDGSSNGGNSTVTSANSMQSIVIGAGIGTVGAAPNNTFIDELRVGDNWADVTPVPEPTTLGLLGMGAMALVAKRRRQA